MRRCRLFPLLILVAGCGGGGTDSVSLRQYPALGASSVDLAFVGGVSAPATLTATGTAQGNVVIAAPPGDGNAVEVTAIVQGMEKNGARLDRKVALILNEPSTLGAGTTYTLDVVKNSLGYMEQTLFVKGSKAGKVVSADWGASSGGTVTVESLSGSSIVLRLEGVRFPFSEGTSSDTILSGTISGTVVAAVDQG